VSVALVGAGPGNKGLLTLRGAELLQRADVVLYDRIVGADILAMIPNHAHKIDVGKNAGHHPVPQEEINRLLCEKAGQELNVVRLKGGDPLVFGRGGEELEALVAHNIPFEVVPGVTSALAGAAYAGIPVTHRDCASSVHIISAHAKNNEPARINYDALVQSGGTLVFMMGVAVVNDICNGCIAAGMDKEMPAAIVENAATNAQRKWVGTVSTLPALARANKVVSPAVIIIGEVCAFANRYDWLRTKPLFGKRIIVACGGKGASDLSDKLRELGCHVIEIPCVQIVPQAFALNALPEYHWLVFTSGVGVNIFFNYLKESGCDIRTLHHLKIACVGMATEREVTQRGINVDYRPSEYNGAALARGLAAIVGKNEKVLIARAKDGDDDLTRLLTEAGIAFDDVPVYDKVKDLARARAAINAIGAYTIDYIAFTSSSAAEVFIETAASAGMHYAHIKAVCIGEKTAATAQSRGMDVHVAQEATVASMIDAIMKLGVT